MRLPLTRIGSTDKVSVKFHQFAGDLRVEGGSACVLFDSTGRVLAIQSHVVPSASEVSQIPSLSSATRAGTRERCLCAQPVQEVLQLELAIVEGLDHRAQLAYLIELRSSDRINGAPIQERLTLDGRHRRDRATREHRAFSPI
jgi:hypothetical protein